MEGFTDFRFEAREEFMISPSGDGTPTNRLAHFIQPSINSIDASVFDIPFHCLSSLPASFEPEKWPLNVNFRGWGSPQRDWKTWVRRMRTLHESTWKKAGIHEAILNSTYEIRRNYNLVLGLAEKWCPETKSFVFPWGEATITLEDVMISGYSVLGSPIFSRLETDEMKETEEKLNQARKELSKSAAKKPEHSKWMKKFMDSGSEIEHEAFLALWLSRFVVPSSFRLIAKSVLPIAIYLARGTRIALAPAILASIYRDFSLLKEKIVALPEIDNWENKDSKLAVNIMSPFRLVQIWAWERFIELRPKPNVIKTGEARFARWHNIMIGVDNVRMALDSAKDGFHWRPYVKTVQNWNFPKFYGEMKMRVSIDAGSFEELESFARCLKISELVGIDCIEQYLPHRVAMQFGMDQDLPARVAQANENPYIAWSCYSKPINYADLYIPSRFSEADVTTRYLDWWKQSLSRLQSASNGALPRKRILTSSDTITKRSKEVKESSFIGFKKTPTKAKGKGTKDVDISSSFKKTPNKLKGAKQRNFVTSFKTKSKRSDGMKKGEPSSIPIYLFFERLKTSPETSKWKKRVTDSSSSLGCTLKRAKKTVETSNRKKEVNDASASAELPSKMLSPSLVVKNEANDSPFPPGFPPKSNIVAAIDSTEEDNLTITKLVNSRKAHDDIWNGQVGSDENLPGQSETLSSVAECEDVQIIESRTEFTQNTMQSEQMNVGSETAMQDSTESKVASPDLDRGRIQDGEGDGNVYASEISQIPALQLEDRVSRLERIIAGLRSKN